MRVIAKLEHRQATTRATEWLLRHQDDAGWWRGCRTIGVTLDAEDLFLRELFGIRTPELTEATARWIRSQQRQDGTWAAFPGGPDVLSATSEAYVALRLAGDAADAGHMLSAARFVRERGGIGRSRMETRTWLAVLGEWPWAELPKPFPEIMLASGGLRLSVKAFSEWSRLALVPLAMVNALRPTHPLPFGVGELHSGVAAPPAGAGSSGRTAHHLYQKRPIDSMRHLAVRRAENWILDNQEVAGSWLGVHPLTVSCLLGLYAANYPVHHPAILKGLKSLDRFEDWGESSDGPIRRMESATGLVEDTCLAVIALTDAGLPGDHPAIRSAGHWLLGEEVGVPGDWAARRRGLRAGGWAFSSGKNQFPDCDNTSSAVVALSRVHGLDESEAAALAGARERGETWLAEMQSTDGGWARDEGTAHAVEALAANRPLSDPSLWRGVTCLSLPPDGPVLTKAVEWALRQQNSDGGWGEGCGESTPTQTARALLALHAVGRDDVDTPVRRGLDWLIGSQHDDGAWDEGQVFPTMALGRFLKER
jgi:squalene-hopene/tetraprenyl-beta-curcumene cyclase